MWSTLIRISLFRIGTVGAFILFLGVGLYGFLIEPDCIKVTHLYIDSPDLEEVLKGKTAVQLSDLHIGKIGSREEEILRILDVIKPDFIFLTGDYVRWEGDYRSGLKFLSRLNAGIGVWAVMGDYDYSRSRSSCLFCHEQGSGRPTRMHMIKFFRNNMEKLVLENGSIWIGGFDPEGEYLSSSEAGMLVGKDPAIVLSHDPLAFDLLDRDQDVLMLSGGTHGGQIPLPAWIWNLLGYEKCARYDYGLFEEGKKKMFVSKGIGTSHVPLRFMRRPEVVVLHFE